jgi:hypothetical protein
MRPFLSRRCYGRHRRALCAKEQLKRVYGRRNDDNGMNHIIVFDDLDCVAGSKGWSRSMNLRYSTNPVIR